MRFIAILLLLSVVACNKNDIPSKSDRFVKFFGNSANNEGVDVRQTTDEGYIVAGSVTTTDITRDVFLIKTDKYGNQQWAKNYGNDTLDDWSASIIITSQGDYVVCGTSQTSIDSTQMYLLRVNTDGDVVWQKRFGDNAQQSANCVRQTSDGGFIVSGSTTAQNTGNANPRGKRDIWIVRTNASGDTLWTNNFGGAGNESGNVVEQKADGGYIIVGTTDSKFVFDSPTLDKNNIIVVETNARGKLIDNTTYGSDQHDFGNGLKILDDGGYIIAGTSESSNRNNNAFLLRLNANIHDVKWSGQLLIGSDDNDETCEYISLAGSELIITGNYSPKGERVSNVYCAKVNIDGKITMDIKNYGSVDGNERAKSVIQSTDGGMVIVGSSGYEKNNMVLILKTDKNGDL